jgi:hypothetical protein
MSIYTVTLAVSPYISIACTVALYEIASSGTVPVIIRVELSNANQAGICAIIEAMFDTTAVCPSISSDPASPSKLIASPAEALITNSESVKASTCTPTSMSKFIAAPANPSTSDAISCIPNVCGGCTRE